MENIEQLLTKDMGRWQRAKFKFFTPLPANWACRTLQDYLNNKHKVDMGQGIIFQSLFYHPTQGSSNGDLTYPVTLTEKSQCGESQSGESECVEAWVHILDRNIINGTYISDDIKTRVENQRLMFPVLRYGSNDPYVSDNRIFLVGFKALDIPRSQTTFNTVCEKLNWLPNYASSRA